MQRNGIRHHAIVVTPLLGVDTSRVVNDQGSHLLKGFAIHNPRLPLPQQRAKVVENQGLGLRGCQKPSPPRRLVCIGTIQGVIHIQTRITQVLKPSDQRQTVVIALDY